MTQVSNLEALTQQLLPNLVKEIARYGGDVSQLVPPGVIKKFKKIYP